jgi:hypothetical protein
MIMLSRLLCVVFLVVMVAAACGSSSGSAPDPVVSGGGSTSAAGEAALSTELLDPLTCQGALADPSGTLSLDLQSLTETTQAGDQLVDTMCAAVYETSTPGDPFLAVALINFDGDRSALAHYDLLKAAFVADDGVLSEVNSADEASLDRFSTLIDRDGIGRTTVLRKTTWVVTISVGPTTSDSPWTATDIEVIGQSILNRAGA